jgi:DNA mismatch endonuclease, patch repair protein
MSDKISAEQRSRIMSQVRTRGTALELAVRRALFAAGFRYRLHPKNLPGSPDIVLPRYRIAVFVHGCFWHGHSCPRGRRPQSHVDFWSEKLDRNMARDRAAIAAIKSAGWRPKVIWQCKLNAGIDEAQAQSPVAEASVPAKRYAKAIPVKRYGNTIRSSKKSTGVKPVKPKPIRGRTEMASLLQRAFSGY